MSEKKEKFIIVALAGILLLIVCLPVKRTSGGKEDGTRADKEYEQTETLAERERPVDSDTVWSGEDASYRSQMETELEALFGCMEGVGRVRVMLTLRSTEEEIVEKDRPSAKSQMTELDGGGGSRETDDQSGEEETVYVTDADGRQVPYVRKTIRPVVEGVAVMAEGGGSEAVRRNISEAIQALFDLDANKIKIAKMKTTK